MSTRLHKERTGLMFSGAALVDRMTVWRVLQLVGLGKEEALDMRAGGLKWLYIERSEVCGTEQEIRGSCSSSSSSSSSSSIVL